MIAATVASYATVITQRPTPPGSERGEEFGKTSPIALVVILLLGIATALLIRSMSKRLRNVPQSFDPPPADGAAPAPGEEPDTAPPDGGTASGSSGSSRDGPPRDG